MCPFGFTLEFAEDNNNSFDIDASPSGDVLTPAVFGSNVVLNLSPADTSFTVTPASFKAPFILLGFMFEIKGVSKVTIRVKKDGADDIVDELGNPSGKQEVSI